MDFVDTSVVITEPYFNFSSIQESMNEILFEEYQFQSALRINGVYLFLREACKVPPKHLLPLLRLQRSCVFHPAAGSLSAHHYFHTKPTELCCLVVDTGFSFTHIVPYCRSKKMKEGIRRSDQS